MRRERISEKGRTRKMCTYKVLQGTRIPIQSDGESVESQNIVTYT